MSPIRGEDPESRPIMGGISGFSRGNDGMHGVVAPQNP
jgi:hypothetical protein